jgi:tetratricopeptide (TPR) repeat protein
MPTTAIEPAFRRRRAPPPLIRGEGETFRGSEVLQEFEEPTAVLLWDSLRSVLLWAEATPEERPRLFLPGARRRRLADLEAAGPEDGLRKPLRVLAHALDRSVSTSAEALAAACRQVSEWADTQGKLATALAFMQTAALLEPDDAEAAYLTGRLARRRAEYARAESWFRQAIAVAQRSGNGKAHALAFIGLGNLHLQRGNFPAAKKSHTLALRIARKHGLREIEGMASHDLFVIADETNRVREAENHAANAFRAYGAGHPRLPNLANDIAYFWMNRGHFDRALRVFRALLPHIHQRRERLLTLGGIARAAGALSDSSEFDGAWSAAWEIIDSDSTAEAAAQALVLLAQGAASLGDRERMERAASRALQVAEERAEAQVEFLVEAVRASMRSVPDAPVPADRASEQWSDESHTLAGELVLLLQPG